MYGKSVGKTQLARKILTVLLLASVIAVAVWQYNIVADQQTSVTRGTRAENLEFELSDGSTIVVPNEDLEKYTVLIFWNSESERSLAQLSEAAELVEKPEVDSMLQFYFVNLNEDREEVAAVVDAERLAPYLGYDPSGPFMDDHEIRVLPLTVVYGNKGNMMDIIEGYDEGQMTERVERWINAFRATGAGGEIKFAF